MGARRPESDPHLTLGWHAGKELYGKCPNCGQEKRHAIAPLARKHGKNTHISYVASRLTCGQCGHKPIPLRLVGWDEDVSDDAIPY